MTFGALGSSDRRLVHPTAIPVWEEVTRTEQAGAPRGTAEMTFSPGSPMPSRPSARAPLKVSVRSETLSLIVSTRDCSTLGVIPPLLEHGFTSVERPMNEALTFLGLLKPGLVIAFVDPSLETDVQLIGNLSSFGAHLLVITPGTAGHAAAFHAGADACLSDGDSIETVSALILALRRRMASQANHRESPNNNHDIAGLQLDARTKQVKRGGAAVHLTPMEFAILEGLLQNSGRVMSSVELQLSATGRLQTEPEAARTIKVYVRRLRSKLAPLGVGPELIANIRGHGYLVDRAL